MPGGLPAPFPAGARLVDLGEDGIVQSIVYPAIARTLLGASAIGDDCAEVPLPEVPGFTLVTTADPCPRPVVFELGSPDYWHYGWLTMVIGLSDLASMGATPVGALISTVMPDEMSVHDYGRFWDGVVDGSDAWTCQILGGNIKDGATFTVDSTAFGVVRKQLLMRRRGSSPGDSVFVVGKLGHFWSAALLKISRRSLSSQVMAAAEAALYRPTAKVREGNLLASSGLVSACMDASDGPLGAFFELARVNDLDFLIREIDADPLVRAAADAAATEPLRLLLAWGDWQLVFTAPAAADAALVELARRHRFDLIKVGRAIAGTGRVGVESGGVRRWLNNLSSKRFRNTSYFSHGFPAHVAWYLDAPLYAHELS